MPIREFSPENFRRIFVVVVFFFFSTTSLVLSNLTIYTASSGTQKAERCQAQIYTPDLSRTHVRVPNWANAAFQRAQLGAQIGQMPGPG
jgi:hypothetical protein